MPKHKHYDVIVAWANGEEIQWSKDGKSWYRHDGGQPSWIEGIYYRVKPKIPMYRLYSTKDMPGIVNVVLKDFSKFESNNLEALNENYIVWLTDWLPIPERKEECPTK